MRKLIASTFVALTAATASFAGGLSPDITTVDVVDNGAASSVSPLLIIGLLILIGVLISRNNNDDTQ